ncbi:hypothetical protein H9X85_09475 [Anaerotignum lactatifermentans]|uniref:DUF3592 domain-containing protein n=1 Tax=Anaerotignum lactatifermentans TaxID=160404 RepID=A0ABS2G972_9FIRM|nr:hypothetical protein [Anaerotignum lactatifermentans]MBM6829777.1 hypothetical protein [Anaerotignum lactatifermentans]MBM6877198.1 hypothetical protein [Anaerotignum lactatifermentans]MBM6951436.1 hypothetical protein [Anaerotignum lactatifermentans]
MKVIVQAVVTAVVLFVVCIGFLVGFAPHPLEKDGLRADFLAQATAAGLSDEEGYVLVEESYYNSVSFLMEDVNGKRAAGSYVRSVFFDKYGENAFYTEGWGDGENVVFKDKVNDGMMKYNVTYTFGAEPFITADDEAQPVLYIKVFGICFAAMIFFLVKMQMEKKRQRKLR